MESGQIQVVEHALKLLATLLSVEPKLKPALCRGRAFDVLSHRLVARKPTFSFLQTLCDFVVGTVTVPTLYPQSNTCVSTIINRSPIATEVLKQTSLRQATMGNGLAHPECLEMLFVALSTAKELHYRINMLRLLQNAIINGTTRYREG